MFECVKREDPPQAVIPGRLRTFAQTNLSHSNWSGGESRPVQRKTFRDSGFALRGCAASCAPE
jgi:hypothetical protein